MFRYRIRQAIITFLALALSLPMAVHADRPKVGLVLSGGGARGTAHIGVLKVLEEYRVPVDYIAGTSMGSIVGGLYASGLSAAEIETIVVNMDWNNLLSDAPDRKDQPFVRKHIEEQFSVAGQPGIRDGEILLPRGLIQGQKGLLELQRLTSHVAHIRNFDELPVPFRAVATDIAKDEMVVIGEGNIAGAMRASMAVPSIFAPIIHDGYMLVDGGLTNNLPVDIVRNMGADIVIAVDISSPFLGEAELENLLSITDQMTRMLTMRNTLERRAMLGDDDILMEPELGEFGSSDFIHSTVPIPLGEEEARLHVAELEQLSLSEEDYDNHLASRFRPPASQDTVNKVMISHNSGLNDEVIESLVATKTGDKLELTAIEDDVENIHSLGNFESVSYRLDHTSEGIDVYLDAAAKAWGPNYLYLGLDMQGNAKGDNLMNFAVGYSREEFTPAGAIWTSTATIGDEPAINTHLYLPLRNRMGPFMNLSAGYNTMVQSIFEENDQLAEYRLRQAEVSAAIGWEFTRQTAFQLGIDRISGKADRLIGAVDLPQPDYEDGGVYAQFIYDSFNHKYFPSAGGRGNLWARKSYESMGSDEEYEQYVLDAARAYSFKQHRLVFALRGGTTNGDSTIAGLFRAGGGPTLLGLQQGELLGQHMLVAQTYYYREYTPIPFLSGYIGGLLEYGGIFEDRDDINADNSIASGSVWFAVDTPVGPFQVGIAATDKGDFAYYTRIGHLF